MKEFLKRLTQVIRSCALALLLAVALLLVVSIVMGVVILLPTWLLSFVIGDLASWWIFIALIGLILIAEWESIKRKFQWLFIEPFSKKTKFK